MKRRHVGRANARGGRRSSEHVADYKNAEERVEIPGFYYDAQRKRYFRVPVAGDHNLMLATDQLTKKEDQKGIFSKTQNASKSSLMKAINDRQIGNTNCDTFCRSVSKQRLRTVKLVHRFQMPDCEEDSECIHLLNGKNNSIVGVWRGRLTTISVFDLYERKLNSFVDSFEPTVYNSSKMDANITDITMKEDSQGLQSVAYSMLCLGGRESVLFNLSYDSFDGIPVQAFTRHRPSSEIFYSVATNERNDTIASGAVNQICLTLANSDEITSKTSGENIHSLSYEENGEGLVAGSHRGCVLYYDIRKIDVPMFKIRTERRLLCHIQKLGTNDDPYVVCSGYDDYLALIDLRMRKEVVRYDGHFNRDQKVRFSVDNHLRVLCSSGQDGRTRLWNLMNGEPIQSIKPPDGYDGRLGNLHSVLKGPDCNVYDTDIVVVYKSDAFLYRSTF